MSEPISEEEQARRLTIQQAGEFKEFTKDSRYPTFQRLFEIAIKNRFELWLSPAGEVDSYAKQLRAEINLLKEIQSASMTFIEAGKNAEKGEEAGAVT